MHPYLLYKPTVVHLETFKCHCNAHYTFVDNRISRSLYPQPMWTRDEMHPTVTDVPILYVRRWRRQNWRKLSRYWSLNEALVIEEHVTERTSLHQILTFQLFKNSYTSLQKTVLLFMCIISSNPSFVANTMNLWYMSRLPLLFPLQTFELNIWETSFLIYDSLPKVKGIYSATFASAVVCVSMTGCVCMCVCDSSL